MKRLSRVFILINWNIFYGKISREVFYREMTISNKELKFRKVESCSFFSIWIENKYHVGEY